MNSKKILAVVVLISLELVTSSKLGVMPQVLSMTLYEVMGYLSYIVLISPMLTQEQIVNISVLTFMFTIASVIITIHTAGVAGFIVASILLVKQISNARETAKQLI